MTIAYYKSEMFSVLEDGDPTCRTLCADASDLELSADNSIPNRFAILFDEPKDVIIFELDDVTKMEGEIIYWRYVPYHRPEHANRFAVEIFND